MKHKQVKHKQLWCAFAAAGCLLFAAPAFAQIANGNFNGNLNSWNGTGFSASVGTEGIVVPISGSFQALIASGGDGCPVDEAGVSPALKGAKKALARANAKHQLLAQPGARPAPAYSCGSTTFADASEAALETFLNLPSGAINTALPDLFTHVGCSSGSVCTATTGAAIFQQFTVSTAPTTLSFYWNMGTNEDLPTQWDGALYSFRVGTNPAQVFELGSTQSSAFLTDAGSNDFADATGYHVVNIPINANGTYSIGFLSMQTGDTDVSSGTYISNVQLGAAQLPPPTPVPASWYLVLVGIATLAFYFGWQGRAGNRA